MIRKDLHGSCCRKIINTRVSLEVFTSLRLQKFDNDSGFFCIKAEHIILFYTFIVTVSVTQDKALNNNFLNSPSS